jgi:hypothetical protein
MVRIASRLGIQRQARDVTELSLEAYQDSAPPVSPAEPAGEPVGASGRPMGKRRRRKADRPEDAADEGLSAVADNVGNGEIDEDNP